MTLANFTSRLLVVLQTLLICGDAVGQTPLMTQTPPRSFRQLKPPSVKYFAGPIIPGLRENAVPQGIAYAREQNRIIISHYFENAPSCLSVLDNANGRMIGSVLLKEAPDQLHYGHVGGIAVLKDSLWVASDGSILQYKLAQLVSRRPAAVAVPVAKRMCETKALFCTATSDKLFVGEFAYGKKFPTDAAHHVTDRKGIKKYAWVCGYSADDIFGNPRCVLSVRQRVQGMCVTADRVFLSLSYGRRNRSTIAVYRNPLLEPAHSTATLRDGAKVPMWFLDGDNFLTEIDFPPMAEGIVMIGNRLAVLSESGANKYQSGGKGPLDVILLLDVSKSGDR